ncbi:FecR domain-containing protein [Oscillatoria sp. FACHB-1407]|uniref:FecR domain-containing protein n=1 Tax=Oscillatoria sp. FACHB-1407 TaxID=2692847 RepID=UPI001681C6FF|nr:FecR domain-containing protein [Oscillatoria sp. FACHB-1407]MBD2460422.1 FecR domain-containing protein [Oscillatoria sp. FACHB-1407]
MFSQLGQALFNMWQRSQIRYFAFGLFLCLVLGSLSSPLMAQSIDRATVIEILDSNQVFIQENQARVNDVANRGQRVRTARARANLRYNTGAVLRLVSNTSLTVGECARLDRGVVLVSGAVNGCTPSFTAGVRGTTYVMEVNDDGDAQVKVLEGEVVVARQAIAEAGTDSPDTLIAPVTDEPTASSPEDGDRVVLTAGQKVTTHRGDRRLGPVQQLTLEEFLEILRGELIEGFAEQIPGIEAVRGAFQRLYPDVPFPVQAPGLPIPRPRLPF